ncbi:hypothetical protein [uncultured Dysgonomonas sp.]|uniref:Uncharacterized protein n=1 Tax=uncultured Dysgonomonas sp. TaxID=206096 RepID=A0A212JSQ0_9BACT|nr:hypothetical protein [uncultured Dysgonomonas sp.]SBW02461.1 exported hypothetical protein [uncultured Dysgonomonas sp.]
MKKAIVLFLLCLLFSQSYSQFNLLEEAYKKKSKEKLNEFFNDWQKETPSISDAEFENLTDREKEVYKVFGAFYNPVNLQTIGRSEWGDTIYQSVKYLIVQNSIQYRIQNRVFFTEEEKVAVYKKLQEEYGQQGLDSLKLQSIPAFAEEWVTEELIENENVHTDTITDFRPVLFFSDKKVVYLNSLYNIGLTHFLGTHIIKNKDRLTYAYYLSDKEIGKRQTFLEQNIKVWRGHWGAYWQLLTYPEVNIIVFDKEMKYARVFFRIVYEGGEALLKKEEGEWNIISSKLTWIE